MRLPTLFLAAPATAAAIQNLHLNTLPEGTVPTVHECLDALPPTNKTLRNLWGGRCVSVRIDDDVLRACCRGDNLGKTSWTPARLPLDECLELDGRGMRWREKRQIRARSAESFACSECDFRIGLNPDGTQTAEKVHCSCNTPDKPDRSALEADLTYLDPYRRTQEIVLGPWLGRSGGLYCGRLGVVPSTYKWARADSGNGYGV